MDQHPVLRHLIGKLGDDDGRTALANLLHVGHCPHLHRPTAGRQGVSDAAGSDQVGPGGKVGTLDDLQIVLDRSIRVLNAVDDGIDDLAEVMGRDIGCHADGDAGGTVGQEVGVSSRQNDRFGGLAAVVVLEIHRVFLDAFQQMHGNRGKAALGITHRRRRIVDRAEVALRRDQWIARAEVLAQADQGVVDRVVAVRVIAAHDVADHRCALPKAGPGPHSGLEHGIDDPPLHRLQPVPNIRQRP